MKHRKEQIGDCTLILGDALKVLPSIAADSIDSIIIDPPYGLEFMGKSWDSFGWQSGAGFSKPGIGERQTEWPSFTGGNDEFGGANPTCAACGGRARGKKRCSCETPEWRVKGEKPDRMYARHRQMKSFQDFSHSWACQALRVAKPGAHLLAFGGTRTFHRLACAIEDAGWEIRDTIMWVYGSGFPKSLDVSKAIDKAAGAERERIRGVRSGVVNSTYAQDAWSKEFKDSVLSSEPITDAARQWSGWGTALKPAWEPIIVSRKPLVGTVAENVQAHGTGALNIDGCRVAVDASVDDSRLGGKGSWGTANAAKNVYEGGYAGEEVRSSPLGRWPANLIHDGSEEVLAAFPDSNGQSGIVTGLEPSSLTNNCYGDFNGRPATMPRGDTGSAARFFYTAKASREDRDEGMKNVNGGARKNHHPTVKPTDLMRYLCRLVTPQGGMILDLFMGSGSTGKAAALDLFKFTGIECDPEYFEIACRRVQAADDEERTSLLTTAAKIEQGELFCE